MAKLLFWALCVTSIVYGSIRIHSPVPYSITDKPYINFSADASVNQGFYLIQGKQYPIRNTLKNKRIPVSLGENSIYIYVLDQDQQLQAHLTQRVPVYRIAPIKDDHTVSEALIMTDIMVADHIPLVKQGVVDVLKPMLKRDIYAVLMWFLDTKGLAKDSVYRACDQSVFVDMGEYSQYMALFKQYPSVLPCPKLQRFYPNAYLTRMEFINLLMRVKGYAEHVSNSLLVPETLKVPNSLKTVIPGSWVDPLGLVTKREVIQLFSKVFNQSHPYNIEGAPIVLDWPRSVSNVVGSRMQKVIDKGGVLGRRAIVFGRTQAKGVKQTVLNIRRPAVGSSVQAPPVTAKLNTVSAGVVGDTKQSGIKAVAKKSTKNPIVPVPIMRASSKNITIQPGDSLPRISKQHFGHARYWLDIARLNKLAIREVTKNGVMISSVHIEPGQVLVLPLIETLSN
jgi:hypothetical protein